MIDITYYNGDSAKKISCDELKKIYPPAKGFIWIDLNAANKNESDLILEQFFNFHPLTIEDCGIFIDHPKIDEYENYLFIVFHSLFYHEQELRTATWELDFFVGKNFLVTNHLKPIQHLDDIKTKLLNLDENLIKGIDFLVAFILTAKVDSYYPVLSSINKKLNEVENEVLTSTEHDTINDIYKLKRSLSIIKKVLIPQLSVMNEIMKFENKYFSNESIAYFNDLTNNLQRIRNILADYIEMGNDTLNAHLSISSYKMNKVMKRLTFITTIFMPLTLLSGIGGMSEWSMITGASSDSWLIQYLIFLLISAGIAGCTYQFFKWKKWI
ncbi:magnesium transporter CorA family protein [Candidatus Dependentiae bacterium]|nr:magnesium transporter CorA family protein [Candidatus Dependentiae bacterium]